MGKDRHPGYERKIDREGRPRGRKPPRRADDWRDWLDEQPEDEEVDDALYSAGDEDA
ncbi:MAG: hypothetical protein Kow0092_17760 [Deferrisomatales bacterium]